MAETPARDQGEPRSVLLVDDEHVFLETMSKILWLHGFVAYVAHDGRTAISLLSELTPQAIVLDLKMPGMSGIQTLQEIRGLLPSIPVIILTAHGSEVLEAEARKLKAFRFLNKPADVEKLIGVVEEAISHGRPGGRHAPEGGAAG